MLKRSSAPEAEDISAASVTSPAYDGSSAGFSSGPRSSLHQQSESSGSFSGPSSDNSHRKSRTTPRVARTRNSRSKSATAVVKELQRLKFAELSLYGREEELTILQKSFGRLRIQHQNPSKRRSSVKKEAIAQVEAEAPVRRKSTIKREEFATQCPALNFVTIEGISGQGKSALVEEFHKELKKSARADFLYASGKFEQSNNNIPYSAFRVALSQLCTEHSSLYRSEVESELEETKTNPLLEVLGDDDLKILELLIPNISKELRQNGDETHLNDADDDASCTSHESFDILKSKRRLEHALKTFLHAVCRPERPVIVFVDDLQWIDSASLELLQLILTDAELDDRILVIGAYRADEVDESHTLMKAKRSIEETRQCTTQHISLSDLSFDQVHDLVTDLLNSSHDETRELAEICHKKSGGNPFSLTQFLTALRDESHLEYNIGLTKWTWDVNEIRRGSVVTNNVLSYMIQKMENLPESMKRLLVILSCLGSRFDENVVTALAESLENSKYLPPRMQGDPATLLLLEDLTEEGLLESFEGSHGGNVCCFAHDQIAYAAQSLQNDDTVHLLKREMAKSLLDSGKNVEMKTSLFLIADLWNEGYDAEQDSAQLLNLNLRAAKRALTMSAFVAAIHYCRVGLSLVPEEMQWTEYYDSTVQLYNYLIKAEFSAGAWEHLDQDIQVVLLQDKVPILDKMTAYNTRITVLSSHENKHEEAIALAVNVLDKLGITFRPALGKLAVVGGLIKTKLLLQRNPLSSMYDQRPIDDPNKEAGMEILTSVNASLYASDPDLLMTSVLKMLRWSLKYGTTKSTSQCIGLYGLVDAALGNFDSATSACKTAISFAEKQGLLQSEYAPISPAYGFVFPWTQPLQMCQKQLYEGYNTGLRKGDMSMR